MVSVNLGRQYWSMLILDRPILVMGDFGLAYIAHVKKFIVL